MKRPQDGRRPREEKFAMGRTESLLFQSVHRAHQVVVNSPPMQEKNLESEILNVQGMTNTFKIGAKKPCEGECTVLGLQGDIEYADGKPASNSEGVRCPLPSSEFTRNKADLAPLGVVPPCSSPQFRAGSY
jgi:hypothetical protein